MFEFATVATTLGVIGLARSNHGLVALTLPQDSAHTALERLVNNASRIHGTPVEVSPDEFGTLGDRLRLYASGTQQLFDIELDLRGWTDFQARVWRATQSFPYGETRSYSWVACAAGSAGAQRAAGQALHHNPVPIVVPCHRVIGADGTLTGFGGGLEMKRRLLALEGLTAPA